MEHRIETNVPHFWAENVRDNLKRSFHAHEKSVSCKSKKGGNVVVIVNGNGALLRDVVLVLDWAGHLD